MDPIGEDIGPVDDMGEGTYVMMLLRPRESPHWHYEYFTPVTNENIQEYGTDATMEMNVTFDRASNNMEDDRTDYRPGGVYIRIVGLDGLHQILSKLALESPKFLAYEMYDFIKGVQGDVRVYHVPSFKVL